MCKNKLCKVLIALCGILILVVTAMFNNENAAASPSCIIHMEGGDFRNYITGTGTYFDWIRAFYVNGNGQVAYCTQSDQPPAVDRDNVYEIDNGAICNSEYLHKTVTAIAANGYPLRYDTYIVGGTMANPQYKTGLLINGTIYECTENEARAATAFAIHRRIIAYKAMDENGATEGNDVTITNIENGRYAEHDVVAIQNALYMNASNEYGISLQWVKKNDNGYYTVVEKPEAVVNGNYFEYYVKASSNNCYINNITFAEGENYIDGCIIDDIQYVSAFERYVHVKVPKTNVNGKRIGLVCTSDVPETDKALVLGNDSYQDFMIVPYGKEISTNIVTDYPGGDLEIIKTDEETNVVLPNTTYGIYGDEQCMNKLYELTTDADGRAYLSNINSGRYFIKEISAAYGYVIDSNVFIADVSNGEKTSAMLTDKRVKATIELEKWDEETSSTSPQGDASLTGAVYGIYARENIVYPDKNAEVKYSENQLVGTITIGEDCKGELNNLYLGKYYAKELVSPEGYVLDEKEYDIDCSISDGQSEELRVEKIVTDRVAKQAFQIIKIYGDKGEEQKAVDGAGFKVWLVSDLEVSENGEYDFSSADPCAAAIDGGYEIFTDEKGYACSASLPYGTYIVKETTIPYGYKPVKDFIVTINEDSLEPQSWRILNDDEFSATLVIRKIDGSSGKNILKSGYEFKIFDVENDCYVEQEITYPKRKAISVFKTNDEGYLVLPKPLTVGKYRIEEVGLPKDEKSGYYLSEEIVEIEIASDTLYELENGEPVINVDFPNFPIYGSITVRKSYELRDMSIIDAVVKTAEYTVKKLKNNEGEAKSEKTTFSLYAGEDIYSYDYNVDEEGNRIKLYSKDEKIDEMYVDLATPYCTVSNLPLGKYYITEDETISGYVLSDKVVEVTLENADDKSQYVEASVEIENNLTTTKIFKKDKETDKNLKGAALCIYDEDNNLIDSWTSDEKEHISKGLVIGRKYMLVEENAPEGYEKAEAVEFTIEENNQEITLYNEKIKIVLGESGTFDKNTPHTGDDFNPLVYGVLIGTFCLICVFLNSPLRDQ